MSRRRIPPAAGASATAILVGALVPGLCALAVRDARVGLAAVLADLLVLPMFVATGVLPRATVWRRLLPGLLAAVSLGWSAWLVGGLGVSGAVAAATRVLALVLPGLLLTGWLDTARLGDELGQWWRLPDRPVVAVTAALQQVESMAATWRTLTRVRRARGLGAGRSPVGRARAAAAATVPLLVGVLDRSGDLADAMTTRGLGQVPRRTWAVPARWSGVDTALVLAAATLGAVPLALPALLG